MQLFYAAFSSRVGGYFSGCAVHLLIFIGRGVARGRTRTDNTISNTRARLLRIITACNWSRDVKIPVLIIAVCASVLRSLASIRAAHKKGKQGIVGRGGLPRPAHPVSPHLIKLARYIYVYTTSIFDYGQISLVPGARLISRETRLKRIRPFTLCC